MFFLFSLGNHNLESMDRLQVAYGSPEVQWKIPKISRLSWGENLSLSLNFHNQQRPKMTLLAKRPRNLIYYSFYPI